MIPIKPKPSFIGITEASPLAKARAAALYPWDSIGVGQSFWIENAHSAMNHSAKKAGIKFGKKFRCTAHPDGKTEVTRVA